MHSDGSGYEMPEVPSTYNAAHFFKLLLGNGERGRTKTSERMLSVTCFLWRIQFFFYETGKFDREDFFRNKTSCLLTNFARFDLPCRSVSFVCGLALSITIQ